MSENNMPKQVRGVTLHTPRDVRRVVQRIVSRAFKEDSELQNAGKISQLMASWLKSWELDRISDIERG